jgi:hypothetical protein
MSNALVVGTLSNAIVAAIAAAFPSEGTPKVYEDEQPRTTYPTLSLGGPVGVWVIAWTGVDVGMGTYNAAVRETNQSYNFKITRFRAMPAADDTQAGLLAQLKATEASALIAQLQTGPGFAGIANMPIVHKVSARETSPHWEGAIGWSVMFRCEVAADHH